MLIKQVVKDVSREGRESRRIKQKIGGWNQHVSRSKKKKKKEEEQRNKRSNKTVEIRILFAHRNSYQGVIASISERFESSKKGTLFAQRPFRSFPVPGCGRDPFASPPLNSFYRLPSRHRKPLCVPTPFRSLLRLSVSLHYLPYHGTVERNGLSARPYLKRPLCRCNYRLSIPI